ncbi:hypothetical protein VTG60DRAFT_2436 [Thermothelomyces hinnuleus]
MASSSPVLVLVPGAFGTPPGFDRLLLPLLERAGITSHPRPYPSCDPSATDLATASCARDIASLRDDVKDVVIPAHSYGGVVAGAAAKGLDVRARRDQGKTTAVVGLI